MIPKMKVWDKKNRQMHDSVRVSIIPYETTLVHEELRVVVEVFDACDERSQWRKLRKNEYILMQYSRCKGEGNVDIYEGDKLLIESEEEPYKWGTYVKADGMFSVEVFNRDYDWTPLPLLIEESDIINIKVVGNINEDKA